MGDGWSWYGGGPSNDGYYESPDEPDEDEEEMDDETLGDRRYHEQVDRELEER